MHGRRSRPLSGTVVYRFSLIGISMLVLMLATAVRAQGNDLNVPNSHQLVDYLCGDQSWQITDNTAMTLDSSVKHVIPAAIQQFCVVQNKQNVILQSSGKDVAVVRCEGDKMNQSGFGFVGVNNLTLRNIRFENCGGIINDTTFAPPNTSPQNKIKNKQQAVLLLSSCTNVLIENVTINNYRGYAIFAVNLFRDVRFQRVNITNSFAFVHQVFSSERSDLLESGSGIIFHFNDDNGTSMSLPDSRIYLSDSTTINNNFNIYPQPFLNSIRALRLQNQPIDFPIPGAGGLTIHIEQRKFSVQFLAENVEISNNGGSVAGGTQVASRNTVDNAEIRFSWCTFRNNSVRDFSSSIGGGGLQLDFIFSYSELAAANSTAGTPRTDVTVENCEFIAHSGGIGAAVAILSEAQNVEPISIKFNQTRFVDNEATSDGDCILVRNERSAYYREAGMELLLESIQIEHEGQSGTIDTSSALSIVNVGFVSITGSEDYPTIISNGGNSALKAYDTNLFLSGKLIFARNYGPQGGAISLQANSHLFFIEPTDVLFSNNTALAGGAIYSESVSGLQCVMQFITPANNYTSDASVRNVSQIRNLDFDITFADNSAMDGNSVYAQPLYNCSWFSESIIQIPNDQVDEVYRQLFYFTLDGQQTWHAYEMRGYPYKPCFCHNETFVSGESQCRSDLSIDTFPGRSFRINLICTDNLDRPLRSLLETQIAEIEDDVTFPSGRQVVVHDLTGSRCSRLKFILHSTDNKTIHLDFVIPNTGAWMIEAEVNLQTCPLGFTVYPGRGVCECVPIYSNNNITCDIETGTFMKKETLWIGPTHFEDPIAPASATRCPEGYCRYVSEVSLNATNSISENEFCHGSRTGEICGKCLPGYSMKFGTTNCSPHCSNYYLFTIPVYMLAGILLVLLLFLLKISISSGMLSVVLFYAQLISINLGLLIQTDETRFAYVFISLLNLELGFPVCFYHEMDLIGKQGLQFVFPVYLFLLVALLTILSRYSTKVSDLIGSECIKVFVTLIYLSYTKILRTALGVLVPAYIRTDEYSHVVWFFDGTVKFLSGAHLWLVIISIAFLLFVIVPYKVFLFSAQWCLKSSWISRKFKPLIDASLAPFKDRYRFWFGLRLIIIAVLVVFAIFLSPNYPDVVTYVHLIIIFFLIIFQTYIRPYKSKAVNILDIFFLVNYILFLVGCLFVFSGTFGTISNLTPYIAAVEMISIGTAFVVFVGVVVYHIMARVGMLRRKTVCFSTEDRDISTTVLQKETKIVGVDSKDSNGSNSNNTCTVSSVEMNRLREPLLDDEY